MNHPDLSQPRKKSVSKPKILDEANREKMQKHMSDINDIITEEDIQKIQIDIFRPFPTVKKTGPA